MRSAREKDAWHPLITLTRSDDYSEQLHFRTSYWKILVKAGLLSQSQVDEAVKESGTRQRLIGKTMVARGWLTKEQLQAALEAQSLVRDGAVDVFRALKALGISCNFKKSFEDALQELDPLGGGR